MSRLSFLRRGFRARPVVLFLLVLSAAFARLLPHPPNFTPIGAMALFGGALFCSRKAAWLVPLAAMFVSDLVLFLWHGWPLGWMTLVIYACILGSVEIGRRMGPAKGLWSVVFASFLSALLFFVVTNFAVWLGSTFYPKTLLGLWECYLAALPFFGNTLGAYALYGLALFGGFSLLEGRVRALSPSKI